MLLAEYVATLTESQRLIIDDVIFEAQSSQATRKMLASVRQSVAKRLLELWGEDIVPRQIRFGYEPEWETLDIDWEASFKATFRKRTGLVSFLLRACGLDVRLINFGYGLNLPNNLTESERNDVSIAITVAALLAYDD